MTEVPPFPAHSPVLEIVLSALFSVLMTPQEGMMAEGDSDSQNSLQAGPRHVRTVLRGPRAREGLCQCWG